MAAHLKCADGQPSIGSNPIVRVVAYDGGK